MSDRNNPDTLILPADLSLDGTLSRDNREDVFRFVIDTPTNVEIQIGRSNFNTLGNQNSSAIELGRDDNRNGSFETTSEVFDFGTIPNVAGGGPPFVFNDVLDPATYFIRLGANSLENTIPTPFTVDYEISINIDGGDQDDDGGDMENPDPGPTNDQEFSIALSSIGEISFLAPTLEDSIIDNLVLDTNEVAENELVISELPQSIEAYGTDADFDNQMGLYLMVNEEGGVQAENGDILLPEDDGYASAALNNAVDDFLLRGGSGVNTTPEDLGTTEIPDNSFIGAFLISNGGDLNIDQFLNQNPNNKFEDLGDPVAYFSFAEANPDGRRHLSSLGGGVFGWEDLPNTGDADYNDLIFSLDFSTQVV